jgi:hypothetical protein
VRRRPTLVELIPGKGSGQLKKRVPALPRTRRESKRSPNRVEKDPKTFGRVFVFVHFRW